MAAAAAAAGAAAAGDDDADKYDFGDLSDLGEFDADDDELRPAPRASVVDANRAGSQAKKRRLGDGSEGGGGTGDGVDVLRPDLPKVGRRSVD